MADTTHTIGSTGIVKKLCEIESGVYADAVCCTKGQYVQSTLTPAKSTGSTGGLGKVSALVQNQPIYARVDARNIPNGYIDWCVQSSKQHDVSLLRAHSIADNVTLTLSSFTDTNTIVLNGLTLTGEATAADAAFASRKFSTAGGTDTLDAAELAKLINADYSVSTAGTSVAATDKLTITTDEGEHTIVAAAAADYPAGKYGLNETAGTELASIVLAINHRDTITIGRDTTTLAATAPAASEEQDYALVNEQVLDHNTHTALTTVHKVATAAIAPDSATSEATLVAAANALRTALIAHYASTTAHNAADATNGATVVATTAATDAASARTLINALVAPMAAHIATAKVQANDTVTVNGLTYTGHASTTTAASRQFAVNGANASATADELVTCLEDSSKGVSDITSVNVSGAIGLTRDTAASSVTITAAPAAASIHSCITIDEAGGVPGVIAVATGATAELSITPTWTSVLTVEESGTKLTVTDIDIPGIYATAADAVVTLVPGTPASQTSGDLATVICATAAANCTVASAPTLAALALDSTTANVAINSTTLGTIYTQEVKGWEYCYVGINDDTGSAAVAVTATLRK